jgi:hypothetical protein
MVDLSSYSDAELLAIYGNPATQSKPEAAPAKKKTGFFEGGGRAISRRGVGLIQLPFEALGETDNDIYRASQQAAKNLAEESRDTGFMDTLGEILGDPINAAAAPLAVGRSLLGLAGVGAALGGVEGVTRPIDEGESRAVNTAISAGTGAVATPALAWGAGKLGGIGDALVNQGSKAVNAIKQAFGNVGADDIIGLELSAGSAYDDIAKAVQSMSDDAVKMFKEGINVGLSPRQAFIAAKAKDKGVTLTKGMLTQDAASQRLEDYASQGVLSDKARKVAVDTAASNKDSIGNWASQLLNDVSGAGGTLADETTIANAVGQAVKGRASALKAPASKAYEIGATTKAKVATEDLGEFADTLRSSLSKKNINYRASKQFLTDLKMVDRLTRNVDIFDASPVYHGTNQSFREFKPSKGGVYGEGVYFYTTPERASTYASDEGGNVIKAAIKSGKYATDSEYQQAIDVAAKEGFKRAEK